LPIFFTQSPSFLSSSITRYVVTTNTLEKDVGIENLNRVIEKIRAKVTASEGRLEVKMAPKVVSQRDEADLQAMIKRIEEENEEVDGDAPEDA
jgi:translation initiation factor 2 subunit 1